MKLTLLPEVTSFVMRSRVALRQALAFFSVTLVSLASFSINVGRWIVGSPEAFAADTNRGRGLGRLASGDTAADKLWFTRRGVLQGFSAVIMSLHDVNLVSNADPPLPSTRWYRPI